MADQTFPERPAIPLIDTPDAPELFVMNAVGFLSLGPNIAITLETLKADHSVDPAALSRVVVGRLVMPMEAAEALAVGLYDFLAKSGRIIPPTAEQSN